LPVYFQSPIGLLPIARIWQSTTIRANPPTNMPDERREQQAITHLR